MQARSASKIQAKIPASKKTYQKAPILFNNLKLLLLAVKITSMC